MDHLSCEARGPQWCLMRTETEIAHSGKAKAELIMIFAASLSLKWVMNVLVEDKPWFKQCCCGCTLGRKPQGVGYGTPSIWQAHEQELQGATSAGRSWLSML